MADRRDMIEERRVMQEKRGQEAAFRLRGI
jgi:hypothetical protein